VDMNVFNAVFEQVIVVISLVLVLLGFGGLVIVITTSPMFSDRMMDYAYTFVYSYMLVLGILLYVYRNKILIKR
jgi:hypothetical protein